MGKCELNGPSIRFELMIITIMQILRKWPPYVYLYKILIKNNDLKKVIDHELQCPIQC